MELKQESAEDLNKAIDALNRTIMELKPDSRRRRDKTQSLNRTIMELKRLYWVTLQ